MSRLFALLFVGLASACGGNEPSDACRSLTPVVTPRAPDPVFDWSSECPAGALDVTPSDSADVLLWTVLADPGTNTIRGPATYGIAPTGTAVMTAATPLVSGRQYRVHLRRATGPAGFGLELMGAADFTLP
jgi:hypothetical protein